MKNTKNSITFEQLKKLIKESTHKEVIGERNDETPVKVGDLPRELMRYFKEIFHATVHDNDMMPLPYLYVTIPLNSDISRGGKRLTTGILNQVERKVHKCGWHIIEKFEPFEDCPDYTILISPYTNPHEPGSDEFDRTINKQRKAQADREAEYLSMNDDEVDEATGSSDDGLDFPLINSNLDEIVKLVSDCKKTVQDLYRDARYGKVPATMERRQKVMQAMSDIRNLAHDISQEVK